MGCDDDAIDANAVEPSHDMTATARPSSRRRDLRSRCRSCVIQDRFPKLYERVLGLFADAVLPKLESEYTCGCNCEDSCDYLYDNWATAGRCFVSPWLIDADDDGADHDDASPAPANAAARRQ